MLHKLATHVLHQTQRAAAAIQSPLRNAIQTQAPAGPSSGAGSAKFNAGSRFYSHSGRSLTQGNLATVQDTTDPSTSDDQDEWIVPHRHERHSSSHPKRPKRRQRSQSLSVGLGRIERAEKLGVLKTVQLHARARHAFAAAHRPALPSSSSSSSIPVRRNSISASTYDKEAPPRPPTPSSEEASVTLDSTDPAAPQTVQEPTFGPKENSRKFIELRKELEKAIRKKDPQEIYITVRQVRKDNFLATGPQSSNFAEYASIYLLCIDALVAARARGEPITTILETYNEMLSRGCPPNRGIYLRIVRTLCERDQEVHRVISSLETRLKRHRLAGRAEAATQAGDEERIKLLRKENNFQSAMAVFRAAVSYMRTGDSLGLEIYNALLRSASIRGDVDAAIATFAHLERASESGADHASPFTYQMLMATYAAVKDFDKAQAVFNEFRRASNANQITWATIADAGALADLVVLADTQRPGRARQSQLATWNKMIEVCFLCDKPDAAVEVLQQMLDSTAKPAFGPTEVPRPSSSTFTHIISGFCESGDVKSGLIWFDKLLAQNTVPRHPFESLTTVPRPDQVAWIVMVESLARINAVDDLNRLFVKLCAIAPAEGLDIRAVDRLLTLEVNLAVIENPDTPVKKKQELLDLCRDHFLVFDSSAAGDSELTLGGIVIHGEATQNVFNRLALALLEAGRQEDAVSTVERFSNAALEYLNQSAEIREANETSDFKVKIMRRLKPLIVPIIGPMQFKTYQPGTLSLALRLGAVLARHDYNPVTATAPLYLYPFQAAKTAGESLTDITLEGWAVLMLSAAALSIPKALTHGPPGKPVQPEGFKWQGIEAFLEDMHRHHVNPISFGVFHRRRLMLAALIELGVIRTRELLDGFGAPMRYLITDPHAGISAMEQDAATINTEHVYMREAYPKKAKIRFDMQLARYIDEYWPMNQKVTPLMGYQRFENALAKDRYPTPECIGRLINSLGRLGEFEKVEKLYNVAHTLLESLESDKQWQSTAWFHIEDCMVIACSHTGNLDKAHIHRGRILAQRGVPTADAYGALISCMSETTDDASRALEFFQEAIGGGVRPTLFLYNTVISKLAKARKADFALELFQQMKTNGIIPSSVTYGALIAACCRVGDAQSAELLFQEMTQQHKFKPRVPPYNTMIQFYVHTKPDRARALHFYNAMLEANVRPSAHTYKLLLDCYGSLEPVDVDSMQRIFDILVKETQEPVNGTHWAAMINAWGCASKNVDKAIEVFESIQRHSSTSRATYSMPDAVCYESIINVFVTNRRPDLIAPYLARLQSSDVHMTAYISNLLIKGYASAGDIGKAREVFESMLDPASGVAAPNNHAPHNPTTVNNVPASDPVYREPSTWEAMVRAELGNGDRDAAMAILDRLQMRQYPPAVVQRISGIMHIDVVHPWTTSDIYSYPSDYTASSGSPT